MELEQETNIKGDKNDRYTLSLYRYNGDGQVVSKRDFWTEREDNFYGTNGDGVVKWWQGRVDQLGEAKPNTRFVYSGGQLIAELTEAQAARDGQEAIAGTRYVAGTDGYAAGGGSVVAQAGDTLLSVSQRVYGTSAYWYLLASANGYEYPEVALAEGQRLQVPEVAVSRNDAGTFKPYNANEALGPTTPVLPYIPPSDKGCGAVGQLLMVVVAVIVTVYTAGAASSAATGFMNVMRAGVHALASNIPAATLGGAVGSIASQGVGMLTGNVQSFSWRGVATSALTAGVGAGVGSIAKALDWGRTASAVASGLGSSVANASLNGGFSWRQVAANVVGNLVGGYVGDKAGGALGSALKLDLGSTGGQFAQDLIKGFTGGVVSQAVSSGLMGNSRINVASAVGDALGNALVGRWGGLHQARADQAAAEALYQARAGKPVEQLDDGSYRDANGRRFGIGVGMTPAQRAQRQLELAFDPVLGDPRIAQHGASPVMLSSPGVSPEERQRNRSRYPTGPGVLGGVSNEGYPWPDASRIGGGNTEAERLALLHHMNRYAARTGALPMMTLDTPFDVLAGVNLDYHLPCAERARAQALADQAFRNQFESLEASFDRSLHFDEGATMTLARDAADVVFDDRYSGLQRFGAGVGTVLLAPGVLVEETFRGIMNISHYGHMAVQNVAAASVTDYSSLRFRYIGGAVGNTALAALNVAAASQAPKAILGAARSGAATARSWGMRDWSIGVAPMRPGTLYSNPVPLKFTPVLREADHLASLGGDVRYLAGEHQYKIAHPDVDIGPPPSFLLSNPIKHRHHILELNGRPGVHRALIREGQDILRSYGIDPVRGPENLVWAPSRGHGIDAMQPLVRELRDAKSDGWSKAKLISILDRYAVDAQLRGFP